MSRYHPVGWRAEPYRHYLAAKGVRTNLSKTRQWWRSVAPRDDTSALPGQRKRYRLAEIRPEQHLAHIDPGDYVRLGFVDGKLQQVWVRVKVFKHDLSKEEYVGIIEEQPEDPSEIGVKRGDRVVFRKENVLDMLNVIDSETEVEKRGWQDTDGTEGAKSYAQRNLASDFKGSADDRLKEFSDGVKETLLHPKADLDAEWSEYAEVAGKPELLSDDLMERNVQRGAALVGRVVSQANVEPLVDRKKDRTFREIMLDIEFGRRN